MTDRYHRGSSTCRLSAYWIQQFVSWSSRVEDRSSVVDGRRWSELSTSGPPSSYVSRWYLTCALDDWPTSHKCSALWGCHCARWASRRPTKNYRENRLFPPKCCQWNWKCLFMPRMMSCPHYHSEAAETIARHTPPSCWLWSIDHIVYWPSLSSIRTNHHYLIYRCQSWSVTTPIMLKEINATLLVRYVVVHDATVSLITAICRSTLASIPSIWQSLLSTFASSTLRMTFNKTMPWKERSCRFKVRRNRRETWIQLLVPTARKHTPNRRYHLVPPNDQS